MDKAGLEKMIVFFFVFFLVFALALNISRAQTEEAKTEVPNIGSWGSNLDKGVSETGVYSTQTVPGGVTVTIAKYIGGVLFLAPFFGFLFMVRIVIAGYEWMTAAGNVEKIELAQKRIRNAVIGIVIFTALYFFAYFFVRAFAGLEGYAI
ncbi:MAG: hypothetical protein PHZ04_04105 [Patescibacteria group bacterium]|nr:hypothetical protein [Patescibacteria group bacterium]MDD5554021.1 hypothetical protein [Patescibacteria group bacterium]